MALIVQIADIQCNNGWTDPSGSKWYVDQIDGWDSPPQRLQSISRPSQHGDVTTENLYAARLITVGGICKATSANNFYASMYYQQAQWNALRATIPMVVTEDIPRSVNILRNGPVRTSYLGVGTFRWTATFRADDPYKYGMTAHTTPLAGSSGTSTNNGTVDTYPTFTTTAAGLHYLSVESMYWYTDVSIPSGVVIDFKAMTATDGSTNYFDAVSPVSDWPYFVPGANDVFSSLGGTFTWKDAWL